MIRIRIALVLLLVTACQCFFKGKPARIGRGTVQSSGQLSMVFDFLRKRTEEGIAQVQNIATKTLEGKLAEALTETAGYVSQRRKIDADNLRRLTDGLARSRDRLLSSITGVFADGDIDLNQRLEKLEEVLLQADIGAATTLTILNDLRSYAQTEGLKVDDIMPVLRERLIQALSPPGVSRGINFTPADGEKLPTVIFVIGANGMGKTTTIGKLAGRFRSEGNLTVLLGACDTFRAAAVEQLAEWATRANVSIEVPLLEERGGDPVPVVTRSVRRAIDEKFDVLIVDTSGRLSNNFELIQQLQDMKAAIQKELPSAPHETLLVVDGSVGRNAVDQATAWRKYVGVSGLAITKLDGTARGGFVVSVVRDLGLPVKFIGVGEKIEDLRDFDPEMFVDALLGNDEATSLKLKARVDKMLNLSPAKALEQVMPSQSSSGGSGGSGSSDPSARLKASFGDMDGDDDDSTNDSAINKPKRAKRPKPQSAKPKKAKK